MKELYNIKSIEESVNFYSGTLKANVEQHTLMFGYDPSKKDSIITYLDTHYIANEEKLNSFMSVMKELIDQNFVTDSAINVYNTLLTNEELRSRIRFATDGSYINNRIWANCLNKEHKIDLDIVGYDKDDSYTSRLDYLLNNYEAIFLQVPSSFCTSVKDAINWLNYEEIIQADKFFDF